MAEEIGFENGRNSNFEGLVTLTLDPAIRHTVVHQSSTSTYIPNFIQIEETFCGRTDGHFSPLVLLGRLLEVDLKISKYKSTKLHAMFMLMATCISNTNNHELDTGTYGRRAFAVTGPTAWNSFPDNLRDPDVTMDNFKRLLKTFLFSAYQCN